MIFRLLTLAIAILLPNLLKANPIFLSGLVVDQNSGPLEDVEVELYCNNHLLATILTKNDGRFRFNIESCKTGITKIRVSKKHWQILDTSHDLEKITLNNDSLDLDLGLIKLEKKPRYKITYGIQFIAKEKALASIEREEYENIFKLELNLDEYSERRNGKRLYLYRFGSFTKITAASSLFKKINSIIADSSNGLLEFTKKGKKPFICEMKKGKDLKLIYKVQVLATIKQLSEEHVKKLSEQYNNTIQEEHPKGLRYKYKYTTTTVYNFKSARKLLAKIKTSNKGAFIVCYRKLKNRLYRFSKLQKWLILG